MHLETGEIVALIIKHKYLVLFPIAFLEGPAVAVISGFMVATKFMSFWPTYLILISANITGDLFYYGLGRLTPRNKLDRLFTIFRIDYRYIKKAEKAFRRNRKMAIVFGKIAHAIGTVFLVTAGILRVPLKEYLKLGTTVEFPKALAFLLIGYFFGNSISNLDRTINYSIVIFICVTLVVTIFYYMSEKFMEGKFDKLKDSK